MRILLPIVGIFALLSAVVLNSGCETQSAEDNTLRVEPQATGIRENQSVNFTASGGFSYTWSLSDETLGLLTTRTGPNTTYISRYAGDGTTGQTTRVQTLTVTSQVGPSDTTPSSTNSTDTGTDSGSSGFTDTAEAVIEHFPTIGATTPTTTNTPVSIFPDGAQLPAGSSLVFAFIASGGDENTYKWSLGSTEFGTLSTPTAKSTTYEYTYLTNTPTVVTLTVESGGDSAQVTLTHLPL